MRLINALAKLMILKQPVITVNDAAACLAVSRVHSAKILARLGEAGHLVRLKRGLWAFRDRVESFALPEYLAAPAPAYVSLHSALYHHGMIEQIPSVIYAVTLGRARRIGTPLGTVSLFHVNPEFFFGFEVCGRSGFKVATPEKAIMDILYLASGRTKELGALPEVEFPSSFRIAKVREILRRIRSPLRRQRVLRRLARLWPNVRV